MKNNAVDSEITQVMEEHHISNEVETRQFGLDLARQLLPGTVVALIGDLGTGKTTLTKSIAEGLGVTELVTSPTFTIVHEYEGRLPLYHFDVYRIGSPEEMYELGFEEYFYSQGVSVVEWADLIMELIPEDAIVIHLLYGATPTERIYQVTKGIGGEK